SRGEWAPAAHCAGVRGGLVDGRARIGGAIEGGRVDAIVKSRGINADKNCYRGSEAKAWLRSSRKRFETSGDPGVRIHLAKSSVELDPCAARYRSETLQVPRHYVG